MHSTTAAPVPARMKGIRRPTRSLRAPNRGSMNRARMLSRDMTKPDMVSPRPKVFFRIRGIMLSYICQNARMEKKANPTKMVRL